MSDAVKAMENELNYRASRRAAADAEGDWDESKHKRAPDGKFGSGGGGSAKAEGGEKKAAKIPGVSKKRADALAKATGGKGDPSKLTPNSGRFKPDMVKGNYDPAATSVKVAAQKKAMENK